MGEGSPADPVEAHVEQAARWYRESTDLAPTYFPPQDGLARVAWAQGDTRLAIRRLTTVVSWTNRSRPTVGRPTVA